MIFSTFAISIAELYLYLKHLRICSGFVLKTIHLNLLHSGYNNNNCKQNKNGQSVSQSKF